jgi:CheY-like chemotaxis protein
MPATEINHNGHATSGSATAVPVRPAPPKGLRVLVVEDHEPTRLALVGMLVRRAYQVVTATSLAEARAFAHAGNFNLVISDLGLPDGSGCELMTEMKKRGPVPGIALTGYGMANDITRSREAGFVTHLTKPVRLQSLEAALDTATQSIRILSGS